MLKGRMGRRAGAKTAAFQPGRAQGSLIEEHGGSPRLPRRRIESLDSRPFGLRVLAVLVLVVSGCSASFEQGFYRRAPVNDRLPLSAKVIVDSPGSVTEGLLYTVNFEPGLSAAVSSAIEGDFVPPRASGPDVVVHAEVKVITDHQGLDQIELDAIFSDPRSGTKITGIERSKEVVLGLQSGFRGIADALLLATGVGIPIALQDILNGGRDEYEQVTDQLLQDVSAAVREDYSLKTFAAARSSGGQYARPR